MDRFLPYVVIACLLAFGVTQIFFYRENQQMVALVEQALKLGGYNWDQVKETDARAVKLSSTVTRNQREIANLRSRLNNVEIAIVHDEEARERYEKIHGKEP